MHDGAAYRGAVSIWERRLDKIAANHMFIGSDYP
jgi:hypothetical protein